MSKICAAPAPWRNKDCISLSAEPWPDTASEMFLYQLECHGCAKGCRYSFIYPKKLSFAFVAKLAGVFSSPCRAVMELKSREERAGQLNLLSDVKPDETQAEV